MLLDAFSGNGREGLRRPGIGVERTAAPAEWSVVERIAAAASSATVARLLEGALREAGYTCAYGRAVPTAHSGCQVTGMSVEPPAATLLDERPKAWSEAYERAQCWTRDPLLTEGARRIDPCSWADLLAARPDARQSPAVALAARFGYDDGLVIPVGLQASRTAVIVAAATPRGERRPLPPSLFVAAIVAVHRIQALRLAAAHMQSSPLSMREMQVLKWIMAGKSDWQIGKILSISSKTVNYHVENVKRKFGVATRMQAVVAALSSGAVSD